MYKAVVVGLGPAGASALKRLEELGVKAIGIERKQRLETPTVCGEFLPDPDVIAFISQKPSVKKAFQYIGMVPKLNSFEEVHLEVENVRTFRMKIPGFTVSRRHLAEKLVEGSETILGDDVVGITRLSNVYLLKTRKGVAIEAEYIIAADGYPSTLRRLMDYDVYLDENDLAVGINAKLETPDVNRKIVYMYASPHTPGGYAWIIPYHGNVSNVGIGIRYNYVRKGWNILQLLDSFIKKNPHGYLSNHKLLEPPRSRWIPVSGFYAQPVNDRILFAGDSLGATNPINGGGIFTSMALGIIAAEAVWLENLTVYSERARNEIGRILHIGRVYRELIDFIFKHWSTARFAYFLPDSIVTKIIKGEKTLLYNLLTL